MITITLELEPDVAAGLKRFAEKVAYEDAKNVLYPHVNADIRSAQAYQIIEGFSVLEKALADAQVRGSPWVETGAAS